MEFNSDKSYRNMIAFRSFFMPNNGHPSIKNLVKSFEVSLLWYRNRKKYKSKKMLFELEVDLY